MAFPPEGNVNMGNRNIKWRAKCSVDRAWGRWCQGACLRGRRKTRMVKAETRGSRSRGFITQDKVFDLAFLPRTFLSTTESCSAGMWAGKYWAFHAVTISSQQRRELVEFFIPQWENNEESTWAFRKGARGTELQSLLTVTYLLAFSFLWHTLFFTASVVFPGWYPK